MQQRSSQSLESGQSRSAATHRERLETSALFSFLAATLYQPPRQYALSFSVALNRYPYFVRRDLCPAT